MGQIDLGEVGVWIFQHIGAGGVGCSPEVNRLLEFLWIAPAEVVIPGFYPNVAKDGAPMFVTGRGRAVNVVENLMVVEGVVGRNLTVPFREIWR